MREIAIAEKPDEFARRCVLHGRRSQVDGVASATSIFAVALGAMLEEKLCTGDNSVSVTFIRVLPIARFDGGLGNRVENTSIINTVPVPGRSYHRKESKQKQSRYQQASH